MPTAIEICQRRAAAARRPRELPAEPEPAALPEHPRFDGADYQRFRDDVRLTGQLNRIWNVMKDGAWRTLAQIAQATGDPEPSISAQLRHLRKKRFGAHVVERRYVDEGLYQYRVVK